MYKVKIDNISGYSFKAKTNNYEFNIELKDKGVSPPDLLLASLGSCLGVYMRKYAESSKIELESFNVVVEAQFSQEKPISFREINIFINLGKNSFDERRKAALLGFIKNCPIHSTLKNNPEVNINIA